jgi:transposase
MAALGTRRRRDFAMGSTMRSPAGGFGASVPKALRYIITRRTAPTRFAADARLEADNSIAENAIRGIALGRRSWLFAGSDAGGHRAAATHSVLQTAKLNSVNPQAYLSDTLARIADGHPINRIAETIPWAYHPAA